MKRFLFVITCVALLAGLAGCSSGDRDSSAEEKPCTNYDRLSLDDKTAIDRLQDLEPTENGTEVPPGGRAPLGTTFNPDTCALMTGATKTGMPLAYERGFGPCKYTAETPEMLKQHLEDLGGETATEIHLRRSVRLQQPSGLCDFDPICWDFDRLTDKQVIGLTDLVAYYPFRLGTRAEPDDKVAVIDPYTCLWAFGLAAPDELAIGWYDRHNDWKYDTKCKPLDTIEVNGETQDLQVCGAFPGTS